MSICRINFMKPVGHQTTSIIVVASAISNSSDTYITEVIVVAYTDNCLFKRNRHNLSIPRWYLQNVIIILLSDVLQYVFSFHNNIPVGQILVLIITNSNNEVGKKNMGEFEPSGKYKVRQNPPKISTSPATYSNHSTCRYLPICSLRTKLSNIPIF